VKPKAKPKAQPVHRTRWVRFKKAETKRLIRAMTESGLSIARVECDSTGKVSIFSGAPDEAADEKNQWDSVLTK
jgi:hypothetical protein